MQKCIITAETTCDLTQEIIKERNFKTIPITIVMGLEEKNLPSDSNDYRDIHHIDDETGEAVMFPHPPYMKKAKVREKKSIKAIFRRKKRK